MKYQQLEILKIDLEYVLGDLNAIKCLLKQPGTEYQLAALKLLYSVIDTMSYYDMPELTPKSKNKNYATGDDFVSFCEKYVCPYLCKVGRINPIDLYASRCSWIHCSHLDSKLTDNKEAEKIFLLKITGVDFDDIENIESRTAKEIEHLKAKTKERKDIPKMERKNMLSLIKYQKFMSIANLYSATMLGLIDWMNAVYPDKAKLQIVRSRLVKKAVTVNCNYGSLD